MTAITHAITAQGAQLRGVASRFMRGAGETFAMLDAAIRVANAVERHQSPDPADLKRLGVPTIPRPFH
jgi:hypothetical protein